jgi:hypothetical protein
MTTITIACAVALAVVATHDNHMAHANYRNKILKHARDSLETEHLLLHRRSYTTVKSAKLTFSRVVVVGIIIAAVIVVGVVVHGRPVQAHVHSTFARFLRSPVGIGGNSTDGPYLRYPNNHGVQNANCSASPEVRVFDFGADPTGVENADLPFKKAVAALINHSTGDKCFHVP